MPQVAVALLKIGFFVFEAFAGAAAAATLGAGAAVAIGAAVVVGGTLIAKQAMSLFEVEMPTVDTDASRQRTVKSTTEPQKIIYGEALVSGPISFIGLSGTDNSDLYQTIVLAGHELNDITDIHMDDVVITDSQINGGSDAGGNVTAGTFGPKNSNTICVIKKHLGEASQTADVLLTGPFANYTSAHRGDGIAYLAMKWVLNEDSAETWEKFAPSNVKALVQGKSIYDPRLEFSAVGTRGQDTTNASYITYSTNPALCVVDYLTDTYLGMGIAVGKIDWDSVSTAANGCDVSVPVPGGTESRFTCNGVVFATDSHQKNINKILSSMNGNLVYSNGKYIVHAGIYEAPTETLTEDDLIGAISIKTSLERSDRFNTIKGLFIDPSQNHKSSEFPKVQLADAVTRDNNEILEKEVQYPMTNSSYMAQRLSHKLIQLSDQQKVVSFPANLSALRITAGDRVQVSVEELNWSNKVFQCAGWTFSEDGGVNLTLREDSSTSYNDPTVTPTNEYSTVTGTGVITDAFRGVPSPSGLTATAGLKSNELNWVNPAKPDDFGTIYVYASRNANFSSAIKIGETDGTQFIHDGSNKSLIFFPSVVNLGDTYTIRTLGNTNFVAMGAASNTVGVVFTATATGSGTGNLWETLSPGNLRYYWVRAVKNVGTDAASQSNLEPNADPNTTVFATVGAVEVDWDNVADPTIGIDINNDTISINTGVANTTTGQTVATSGIEAGTTVTQGGITMSGGGSIKGGQSAYNSGTGFFLGYDTNAYKFSIGNAGNNSLAFDGTNLAVTGAITATSLTLSGITIPKTDLATGVQTSLGSADSAIQDADTSVNLGLNAGSVGGITINSASLTSGSHTTYGSTAQGFFLGSDGSMSFADGTNQTLTIDTSGNLAVTGTVNASAGAFTGDVSTDAKFIAGSNSSTVTLDGTTGANYSIFAGADNSLDASFKVASDGVVEATRFIIRDDANGQVLIDTSNTANPFSGVVYTSISQGSGAGVDTVAGTLADNAGEITITTTQAETFLITAKVAIDDNDGSTNNISGASTTSTTDAENQLKGADLKIEYYLKEGAGAYALEDTEIVTFTEGTPSPSQIKVFGVDRGAGYSGSLTRYFAVIQGGGAAEFVTYFSTSSNANRARTYAVTTASISISGAGTHKIKILARLVDAGTNTTLTNSTTPALVNNNATGTYGGSGIVLDAAQSPPNQSSLDNFKRIYEATSANGFVVSAANTFAIGEGTTILTSGGTISGDLVITGDLTVQGTTTTINVADLTVADKDITLNYSTGDSSATANNAGIIIQDAVNSTTDASLLWKTATDTFEFSHGVTWPSGSSANANTAYTYSQVGHLPLAGGTLTGGLSGTTGTFSARVQAQNFGSDDDAKFYVWRALENTSSQSTNYKKIARVTGGQSQRFMITLTGRNNSYGDGSKGSKTEIYGQLNNDNNYDLTYTNYDFSATGTAVTEVGYIDVSSKVVDIYVKVGSFSELAAYAVVSDGTLTPATDSATTTAPTGYTAATSNTIWTDNSFSSASITAWNSAYTYSQVGHLPLAGGTLTGAVSWPSGGSANANTAYTYSQVGHLPLAGGTLSGNLSVTGSVDLGGSTDGSRRFKWYNDAYHTLYYNGNLLGTNVSADVLTYYENFVIRHQDTTNAVIVSGSSGNIKTGGSLKLGKTSGDVDGVLHVYNAGSATSAYIDNRKTYGTGTGTADKAELILSLSENDTSQSAAERPFVILRAQTRSETNSGNALFDLQVRTVGNPFSAFRAFGDSNALDFPINYGNGVSDLTIGKSTNTSGGLGYATRYIGVNVGRAVNASNMPYQNSTFGGITGASAIALNPDDNGYGQIIFLTSPQDSTANTQLSPRMFIKGNGDVVFNHNVTIGGKVQGAYFKATSSIPSETSTNTAYLDYASGDTRIISKGPDGATLGGFRILQQASDSSPASSAFIIDTSSNATFAGTISSGAITSSGDILLDSSNAEINIKSGGTGTSGAVNWTFNSTGTNYASLKLPYDTRATTGFHIDSGYPITIDATTRIRFDIAGSNKGDWDASRLYVASYINTPYIIATATGMSEFATNLSQTEDWLNSPITIRERGLVAGNQTGNEYSPNLNFHWAGKISRSIWMDVGGTFNFGEYGGQGIPSKTSGLSVLNAAAYQINNTTVIDSSRNMNNIGTISSGAITSSGDITAASNLFLRSAGGEAGIYLQDSSASNATAFKIYADVTLATSTLYIDHDPSVAGGNWAFVNGGNFLASGTIYADGAASNSLQWEAGYDYSQVGHLPLAGGTLTGTLAMGANAITSTGTISSGAIQSSGSQQVSKVFTIPNTGGNNLWIKLGNFACGQSGQSITLRISTNAGYNALDAQNSETFWRFKSSNNSSNQNGFYGDSQVYKWGPNASPTQFRVVQVSSTSFDLWAFFSNFTGDGSFVTVNHSGGTWTKSMATQSADPGGLTVDINRFLTVDNLGSIAPEFGSNLTLSQDKRFISAPNSTWSNSISFGGNGANVGANQASVATTNGNLHLDAASGNATYINFYGGTSGLYIGNGSQVSKVYIDSSGNITAAGNITAYGSPSDLRLKENIEVIPDALAKVKSLRGVTFNYKKDGGRSTGLIAQELQEVLPEVVYVTEDIDTKEEHLAVRYGNVVGLLVEAIKELTTEVEYLKLKLKEK